jgi:hypothetical protein
MKSAAIAKFQWSLNDAGDSVDYRPDENRLAGSIKSLMYDSC